jgi:hypothetical protein
MANDLLYCLTSRDYTIGAYGTVSFSCIPTARFFPIEKNPRNSCSQAAAQYYFAAGRWPLRVARLPKQEKCGKCEIRFPQSPSYIPDQWKNVGPGMS